MLLELFTIHHRQDPQLQVLRRHFTPIQVGSAIADTSLGIMRDDTLGRLSARNRNYCELTAFDEIAQRSRADYIGVMHYRRVFTAPKPLRRWSTKAKFRIDALQNTVGLRRKPAKFVMHVKIRSAKALDAEACRLKNYLSDTCGQFDLITPVADKYPGISVREHYAKAHPVGPFDRFLALLETMHPQLKPYVQSLDQQESHFFFNMFIMRRDLFLLYWQMLSSTLLALETELDLRSFDTYQARVFGFLAERFMGIFVRFAVAEMSARTAELPVAKCLLEQP